MNLRNAEKYNIGLDIGTGSVGWAVTGEDGALLHFKGRPTWGSRLFPSADPASKARVHRGQRRRYDRRRQRLDLLQELFAEEMYKVDPDFFIRLRQSRLFSEDREAGHADYRWPLFNDSDFTEVDYYKRFPTIYHLRAWLMSTEEKADIRLVYLAFHNIVKCRGNFLHQDTAKLSAKSANMKESADRLKSALEEWCAVNDVSCGCKSGAIADLLEDPQLRKREKQERLVHLFGLPSEYEKTMGKAIAQAIVGYKAEFAQVFFIEAVDSKFALSDDEKVDAFLSVCPDEGSGLFEAIQAVHSSFVLMGILKNADGDTLSFCKVRDYEQYGQDLNTLKQLVRKYAPGKYDAFFRGEQFGGSSDYDPSKAQGYTKYNLGTSKLSYDDFKKEILKLFKDTAACEDPLYVGMMQGFDEEQFLRRLKTSDNGSIPFQLHLEEMDAIIQKQMRHYPFLGEKKRELDSLVTFRIPYYVGPLTMKNARRDGRGEARFAWSVRKEGQEQTSVKPWNWEEVIDKNASAEAFIRRMTGTCTYLRGEPVLPKCSLLYEEFCVLNELNGARWSQDGDDFHRFDYADRVGLIEDLFKHRKVTYKQVEDWLLQRGRMHAHVKSGQGERGFESKLSSYIFFCKDVFDVEELPEQDFPMIEEIILWNTLFEDRSILKEKLIQKYGDRLNAAQIKKICKKRFTGWGRLSKELLSGIKAQTDNGPQSIMDILREGNPNCDARSQTMILMEVLHDENLGFETLIDERNKERAKNQGGLQLDELPGSPALRRSINQALRIVDEIVGIAGKEPENIFIEVTRDEDERKKGSRTKRRYDHLKEALSVFKKEDPEIWRELGACNPNDLDERLTLYFMQRGKSLYSGKPLDIRRLVDYEVDHIIPQSYVKDDSFENKALVLKEENQRKLDNLLLDSKIRKQCAGFWKSLREADLIGEKKYQNLMRDRIGDKALRGFIARQLVETSQIVKFAGQMLEERHEKTRVVPIKASISSQLRKARGFVKCREINDYHHAHDAYLACEIGRFIQYRHPQVIENPIAMEHAMRSFVKKQAEEFSKTRSMPGSSSFIVESFLHSGFDAETGEIFKDAWDAEAEVERIRRFLNYKDCFISRMPEETSGAFWDATIYSPKGSSKSLGLPLKKGLDPQKYGSFSREQFAYFFVYEALNQKKNKKTFEFEPVPVSVAAEIAQDEHALEEYAVNLAEQAGLKFVRIARAKVYKYQLIELDGNRLYITGKKEARNATQLAFSQKETELLKRIVEGKDVSDEEIAGLFDKVIGFLPLFAKKLAAVLKLDKTTEAFRAAESTDRQKVLLGVISLVGAKTNVVDLTSVSGVAHAGRVLPTFSKEMSESGRHFFFIDQSVTGMFEKRSKLEF